MNGQIKEALDGEILEQLKNLGSLEAGSKEEQNVVDNVVKLCRVKLDGERNETEADDKFCRRETEAEKAEAEAEERKAREKSETQDRFIKYGIEAAKIILPMMFYGTWMKRGLKFEETGSFTSTTFHGLISKFRPTAK